MNFTLNANVPAPIGHTVAKLAERYTFSAQNEEGGNGYVFICQNKLLNTQCVVKFYNWEGEDRYHLEPQALTEFDSENVLKVLDAGIADDSWAYFVTPYCSAGSLETYLRPKTIGNIEALNICSEVLDGLTYLHSRRYVHRDLKPGNIYLHERRAVIGDFGSLVPLPEGTTAVKASRHSVLYRPPESVASDSYGFTGDIYQVGLILYQLLGGNLPYREIDYLTPKQITEYKCLSYPDNTIFADKCLKTIISKGHLVKPSTVDCWASRKLIAAYKKATRTKPADRFKSAAEFLAGLAKCRPYILDWTLGTDKKLTLKGTTQYRICTETLQIHKRRASTEWRADNSFSGLDLATIVRKIEQRQLR